MGGEVLDISLDTCGSEPQVTAEELGGTGSISTSAGKAVEGLLKLGPAEDPDTKGGADKGASCRGGARLEDTC
jgi:hypothetical protein